MLEATEFLALIVWIGLLPLCWGYVNWIYPGPLNNNLTFNYIDSVYFTWASSVEEPWMNLWCAPSPSDAQSRNYLYHAQVPANGSNCQSFQAYGDYDQHSVCHMQVESFSGDDFANTPNFAIISKDNVEPKTWGLDALGEAGGNPNPFTVQRLGAVPSTLLIAATSVSQSSAAPTLSSTLSSQTPTYSSASSSSPSPLSSSTSSATVLPLPSKSVASASLSSDKTSLTSAAIAGICIGSVSAFLIITVLLLLAWLRWRRQQQRLINTSGPEGPNSRFGYDNEHQVEIEGVICSYEIDGEGRPHELQGMPRAEL